MAIEIPGAVESRLRDEQNIWFTTTRADGMPLPNTVWFIYAGGEFVILTPPDSVKMKNMRRNPNVALNFNTISIDGSDVDIFQGEADVNCAPISDAEFTRYTTKYAEGLQFLGFTHEALREAYVTVRVKVVKYRTVAA